MEDDDFTNEGPCDRRCGAYLMEDDFRCDTCDGCDNCCGCPRDEED